MEQRGQYTIPASRVEVWNNLQDPDVLAACLEGCDSMTRVSDHSYDALVTAKVGPVKAKFSATIRLEDLNPPRSYSLLVDVKGGAAGFGNGRADVELTEQEGSTVLTYAIKGTVGGKLAQIGSRLVQSVSRRFADRFFAQFSQRWVT